MKFMQIILLKEIFRSIFEKAPKTKDGSKEISSMHAFFIGTATRIGTGNMAGVECWEFDKQSSKITKQN